MGKSYVDYGKKIADASTIELLKKVRMMLHWCEKEDSIEAAEKFLQNFFQAKIDSHFEADRMMFLNLPDGELQNRLDDETYEIVNTCYVDGFMQGFLLGIMDMQELASLMESVTESGEPEQGEPEQAKSDDTPF